MKITLGPRGRNVVLDKPYGSPLSTKDGVTVAKEIELDNRFENIGAQMVREVASTTSEVAGDGTTTATVLAQAIYREGHKQVTAGHNPMEIKRGMAQAVEIVVDTLRALSRDVKDKQEIAQVGTIAANHDQVMGDLIAEAMEQVGKDGVITVEEGHSAETTLEVVEGMQLDRGYLSPYFVTDAERMEAVLDNPYILLHEKKLSHLQELLPVLEQIAHSGRALADHCGGCRERSPGDVGGQQAAWHAPMCGGQGAGVRRAPQGDDAGYRGPDAGAGHLRGRRHEACERHAPGAGACEARHDHEGGDHDRRRRGCPSSILRVGAHNSGRTSRRPRRSTTASTSTSAWRTWSVAAR